MILDEPARARAKMHRIFLSRRNLLTLLAKLDRQKAGDQTECTIVKRDNMHPVYPQTMAQCAVKALEDEEYYTNRGAGQMHALDELTLYANENKYANLAVTVEMRALVLKDLKIRLALGPNDEAAIGAYEILDELNRAAHSDDGPCAEDGPDSEGFRGPRPWNGFKSNEWVNCPVCGEPDMRKEHNAEGQALIFCTNHGCLSNGGTMQK